MHYYNDGIEKSAKEMIEDYYNSYSKENRRNIWMDIKTLADEDDEIAIDFIFTERTRS